MTHYFMLTLFFVSIVYLSACNLMNSQIYYLSYGSKAGSNDIEIYGGNLFFDGVIPGVVFALHKEKDQPLQFSYIMLIKHPSITMDQLDGQSEVSVDNQTANEFTQVTISDFYLNLQFEMSGTSKVLTLNSQRYEGDALRLFLIDMTNKSLEIEAIELDRDPDFQDMIKTFLSNLKNVQHDWFETYSYELIGTLSEKRKEVKDFLEQ